MLLDIISMSNPGVAFIETAPPDALNSTYIIGVTPLGAAIPAGGVIMVVIVTVPEPAGIDIMPVYEPTGGTGTDVACACN